MVRRLLQSLLLVLMLSAAGANAYAGTTYTFSGGTVGNCTLAGATYSCPSLPLTGGDDAMVIASGFRVDIAADATFGSNHSLTMSGSAILSSAGNLDISGIKTSNLDISGGTLIAGKTFSTGAQKQTLTADIQAADAHLGTGSDLTLNGNVTVTGTVDIATHATISGAISGAIVTAKPGAELHGNIVATQSFTLGSQGTVVGDISAPIVQLLPAQSTVKGKITATVSLELGSQVEVTGDVVAGTLTLNPAKSMIYGKATVDSAVLGSQARITKVIHCNGGTRPGKCDCVTNNSGYEVNTELGPTCEGNAVGLDHFVIAYDPAGSVCEQSTVTVTACANSACTNTYGGGAAVTLAPTGQSVAIPASGVAQVAVSYTQAGLITLGVTGATAANATVCRRYSDAAPGADCQVTVAQSAYALTLNGKAFQAEAQTPGVLALAALRFDNASKSCVPLFNNTTRNVTFTCTYANPASGTVPIRLNGTALNAGNNKNAACDNAGATLALTFDADGKVTLPMQYADAGQVTVTATDNGSGSPPPANVAATFVPAAFRVALAPATGFVAGQTFGATVTALNGGGGTTANFGRESPAQSATLAAIACQPVNGNGLLAQSSTLNAGVQTFALTWSEVGSIDLAASLASGNYLGSGMQPPTATLGGTAPACSVTAGRFIPAYFTFDADQGWARKASVTGGPLLQYYSGEPAIKLTVTARNKQNGVTQNYADTDARDVAFQAFDADTKADLAGKGAFSPSPGYAAAGTTGTAQLRAADFTAGVATWTGSYTFPAIRTAPARIRVRATDADGASSAAIPTATAAGAEPALLIRSGRVRISNAFGAAASLLKVPVALEYYTGQSWVLNAEDSTTAIPAGAISVGTALGTFTKGLTTFTQGGATLSLTPPAGSGRGAIPVALDLGSTAANTSCYAAKQAMTPATGAGIPYLRSADAACNAAAGADPSAMATFGVYAPETKRVIHVREVYR